MAQVAEEIFSSAPCFYEKAMRDADVWFRNILDDERDRYLWSRREGDSFAARESSLFHKHKPVVSYGYDELDEPMHNGTVSMWEMCSGLLGNVHFTLPLAKNSRGQYVPTTLLSQTSSYSPYTPSTTPNVTSLESFILQVSKDAFEVSPFYRHYGMHHLASNSAGCPDYAAQAQQDPPGTPYTFLEEQESGHGIPLPLTHGSDLSRYNISRKGLLSGLLGASPRHSCFCGFESITTNETQCILPTVIHQDVLSMEDLPPTPDMAYLRDTISGIQGGRFYLYQNERVQRTLRQIWRPARWPCPEMDPSDHWGIVRDAQAWVTSSEGTHLLANDFLEVGSGGLRVGTVGSVLEQSRFNIHPGAREGTMNHWDGSPITGHTRCEMHRDTMRPESLADHFVNDLFPAAQGVVDSPAVSHCMRFAIEMARLSVIAIVTGTNTTVEAIVSQMSATARSWKKRCSAQLDLLGICAMTGALDARDGVYSTGNPTHCAFRLDDVNTFRNSEGYITPGCLVYVYGSPATVHDPCQFYDCSLPGLPLVLTIATHIRGEPRTMLRFNPMDLVDPLEIRGTWAASMPLNSTFGTQEVYEEMLKRVEDWHDDLTRDMPGRLTGTSLFRRALLNEERSGVGSPNMGPNMGPDTGQPLKAATEQQGAQGAGTRHCDMMVVSWGFIDPMQGTG